MGDYRDNAQNYVAFVMLKRNRSAYSFCEYMDKESGEVKSIKNHIDPKTGLPVPRRFKWTSNQPVLKIPKAQKDVIEFLRNSPECYKSPNAKNPNAPKSAFMFAEINDADDAKIANDASKYLFKALQAAHMLEAQPEKLERIARMVGETSNIPDIQLSACVNYAKSNTKKFLELVGDDEGEARQLVEQAIAQKIIVKQGFMYRMGSVHVGSHNVDNVVSKVSGDPDLFEALKIRLAEGAENPVEDESDLPPEFEDLISDTKEKPAKARSTK